MKGTPVKMLILGIALIVLLPCVSAATIKGTVFEWFNLEPLEGVIIDVNSTPQQRVITQGTGEYSFDLPVGTYSLHAEYYEHAELLYSEDEKITIAGEGEFNLDLVMFPVLEEPEEIENGLDVELILPEEQQKNESDDLGYGLLAGMFIAVLAFIVIAGYLLEKRKRKPWEHEAKLDEYAEEVVTVLRKSGNRLTQKELRERVSSVGEAKISLILTELEAAGKIKKIKKGRGNVIVLTE